MPAEPKTKRFPLSIVGAGEQVPRLITGIGSACGGQFGLVLRPTEHTGTLVHLRKDGVTAWSSTKGDSPRRPEQATTAEEAVARIKALKASPPAASPVMLKGAWKGVLVCDDQAPRIELERKVASYGSLHLTSSAEGWTWKVVREGRWFAGPAEDSATKSVANLADAIGQGTTAMLRVAGQACATRDTHRRGALDSKAKPVVAPKERPDRTDKLGTKKAGAGKRGKGKKADTTPAAVSPWTHFAHDDEVPNATELAKVPKAVREAMKAGRLRKRDGTFLGLTTRAYKKFPRGSVLYIPPEDNAGFYLHRPVEDAPVAAVRDASTAKAPKKAAASPQPANSPAPKGKRGKKAVEADPAKDQQLLELFAQLLKKAA